MSITPRYGPAPAGATWCRPKLALEAFQLTEDCDWQGVADWCAGDLYPREGARDARISVLTEDGGIVSAYAGDWIVRGPRRFMVCGPRAFTASYDPAEPPASHRREVTTMSDPETAGKAEAEPMRDAGTDAVQEDDPALD